MSTIPVITFEDFLAILQDEFKKNHIPYDIKNIEEFRYCELNYSVRLKAVARVTKDVGVSLNKDDYNHVVVGRLNVREAHEFMDKKRQEAQPITKYTLLSVAQSQPLEASLTKGGLVFEPVPFKF